MKLSCSLKEAAYSAGETPHMAPAFAVCHLAPLDLESPVAEILARVLERVPLFVVFLLTLENLALVAKSALAQSKTSVGKILKWRLFQRHRC